MKGSGRTITAESTPVYDGWGFDDHWQCYDWIQWHKAMKRKYGLQKANDRFAEAWNKQSVWDKPYNWCKYDNEFSAYLKEQGMDAGHVVSKVITGAEDLVDNTSDAAKSISNLLPTIVLLGAVGYGLWIYTENKKDK